MSAAPELLRPAATPEKGVSAAGYPSLVADVGGTNARFGWLAHAGAAVADVQVLPVREHGSPLSAVQAYLALQQARLVVPAPM